MAAETVAQRRHRDDAPSSHRSGVHADPGNPFPPLRTTTRNTAVRPRSRARLSILYVPLSVPTRGCPSGSNGDGCPDAGAHACRCASTRGASNHIALSTSAEANAGSGRSRPL
jgi:hypothetical protein